MAARPNPHSSLRVCIQLARNSIRRLEAAIDSTKAALDTNTRLTPHEQASYTRAVDSAVAMKSQFEEIAETKLPSPPSQGAPRKIGRPTRDEVARWSKRKAR